MKNMMRIVCAGVACGFLVSVMTASAVGVNAEQHAFTNAPNTAGTVIPDGYEGWIVANQSGGTSVFSTATIHVYGTTITDRIVAKLQNSTIGHDYTNALDQRTNIWLSMRIRPVLNATVPTTAEITNANANAAAVVWFGSDSNVYYYNGGLLQSNSFANVVTNETSWYVVTAHLKYATTNYDLFINSTNDANRVVSDIGFYSVNSTSFTNPVKVIEKSTVDYSYLDYVGAATSTNTALAAQIFMRAYLTAEGVVIEFTTIQEQAAGVVMSVYRADGSLVGTVISQGNNGSYTYRLIDSLAVVGGSYNYSVVDDEGITRQAQVTVGDQFSTLVEMTATSIKLNWKSVPGLRYDIYKAVSLSDGFTKVNADPILASDYTTSCDVPLDNGVTRAFFKIRGLSPNP